MPPRTTLSLNLTATFGMTSVPLASATAQFVVHDPSARLTKRYSALRSSCVRCDLDAGADRPAGFGRAADRIVGEVRPEDIPEGGAAGAVDKEFIECVASAATHVLSRAACCQASSCTESGSREGAKAAGIGPIAVGLDAEHERPDLVIGAHGSSPKTNPEFPKLPVELAVTLSGPIAGAEGQAAVEAEIDTGRN